jgi:HD domain
VNGYSDRIHHALAFAAKHHDQQVRKGLRAPYLTQPASVAIILTRYGQDDATVLAGILHDVVHDFSRNGLDREGLEQRLGGKFGDVVLDALLSIAPRRTDDHGIDLSPAERRDDVIARLPQAHEIAWWVCAADALHHASTLLTELHRTVDPESVWSRTPGARDSVRWYRRVHQALARAGFLAPIMAELDTAVRALEAEEVRPIVG